MKYLSYLLPVAILLGVPYIVYSMIFPLHAAVPTKQPFTVITKKVVPGGVFKYEASICKYTSANGVITRQILGTESKFINQEPSNLPKGCASSTRAVTLPEDTAIGKYKMIITAEYHINAFHTDTVRYETEEFEVVAPDNWEAPKPNTPGGKFIPTTTPPIDPVVPVWPVIPIIPSRDTATSTLTNPILEFPCLPLICK